MTDPRPTDFRQRERLRVRWAEVDLQKVVFNGHYLTYVDTAMAGYWRAMALPYEATLAALGSDLYVRGARLDYRGPARFDDVLEVGIRRARVGSSSIAFDAAVFRADLLLVQAELVYVHVDLRDGRPAPVPPSLVAAFDAYEAGEPMFDVTVGGWAELGEGARALRLAVFVQEQGIPAALEIDDADSTAVHAVARNRLGAPVATGRLLQALPGVAKIGRMAVAQGLRGSRVGRGVLDALMQAAAARGDREVLLHAQSSAVGFYRRAGFVERGDPFDEAGIRHVEMVRALV